MYFHTNDGKSKILHCPTTTSHISFHTFRVYFSCAPLERDRRVLQHSTFSCPSDRTAFERDVIHCFRNRHKTHHSLMDAAEEDFVSLEGYDRNQYNKTYANGRAYAHGKKVEVALAYAKAKRANGGARPSVNAVAKECKGMRYNLQDEIHFTMQQSDRGGYKRLINVWKRCGIIAQRLKPRTDPTMFKDVWLCWKFQANYA